MKFIYNTNFSFQISMNALSLGIIVIVMQPALTHPAPSFASVTLVILVTETIAKVEFTLNPSSPI